VSGPAACYVGMRPNRVSLESFVSHETDPSTGSRANYGSTDVNRLDSYQTLYSYGGVSLIKAMKADGYPQVA